jgi:hypothetical protein
VRYTIARGNDDPVRIQDSTTAIREALAMAKRLSVTDDALVYVYQHWSKSQPPRPHAAFLHGKQIHIAYAKYPPPP